jgi:outer membrane protein
MDLSDKLLASANKAFDLAQERYQVGSSSIIELSLAQLNQTEARLNQAKAVYEFHIRDAILNYQIGKHGAPQ